MMKGREHDRIMREREKSVGAMRQRHKEELARQKHFFDGEVADRERVMDNYANALSQQDATIAILSKLLAERGVDHDEQDQIIGAELAKLNDEDEVRP